MRALTWRHMVLFMAESVGPSLLVSGWGSSTCWTRVVRTDHREGENGEGQNTSVLD